MNRKELAQKIKELEGLSNEDKCALLELLSAQKKYGLVWEDKPEEAEMKMLDHLPVLKEVPDRAIISDNPDAPNHLLIEGDNLEALTALSYTHAGKIDVIYIDPPYNTGKKDFVYNDAYVDTDDEYKHSKWLSFIKKRLELAKKLLSDRGVIFISIDDNEQARIKVLCDEKSLFGENNFLGQLILKTATDNNPSQISTEHEYMLCYAKNHDSQPKWLKQSPAAHRIIEQYRSLLSLGLNISDIQKELRKWIKQNKELLPQVAHYNNVDEKGVYSSSSNSSNPHPGGYTYDIFHPITHLAVPKPQNGWRWPEATFLSYAENGEIEWGKDHTTQPHVKKRIETCLESLRTLIYEDNRGTTKALSDIFGGKKVFDNPKPHTVLARVIDFASQTNSVVLDFFAGSGTTLHAVMNLNAEDGGHRTCILCTNNENGICENVTYERNKRVIEGYTKPNGEEVAGLTDNNLHYFRSELLPSERTIKNMKELVKAATGLLCIRNDIYTEAPFGGRKFNSNYARYFEHGNKRMLVIYNEQAIPFIVNIIKTMPEGEEIKVYVFAYGSDPYEADFVDVKERVTLCALPDAIYNAYKKVLPKRKPQFSPDALVDEIISEEEAESIPEGSLDFNNGYEQEGDDQ